MVAAAEPAGLLVVDGQDTESPGYALPGKDRLTVGGAAKRQAAKDHVIFGRNEPALHHYHNTYNRILGLDPLEVISN